MALDDFSKYTKIAVNPALPKNEKDLICALLAGRLRNLFNGRLFCLDLAIGDLIKDASGYGLNDLVSGLKGLRGSLNDLKNELGYDQILGSINQALGGIGSVFSLGGLCPSPIRPPQIPDIMPQVNAALFGQGMNIINALGKVANPKTCFGGGPGGFGVNYSSMPGALSQLKNSLDRFKNDPAGLRSVSKAFEANIKMQERRLKSELNRLRTNLADPFGIQQAKQRVSTLKAINNRSADYKVVDNKGIQHTNTLKSLVPSDTLSLLNVMDNTPILYKREPVLNYCGEEVGIRIVPVSGDLAFAGWDTNPAADNATRPFGQHILPPADYAYYDFVIVQENNVISAYKYNIDTKNLEAVQSIALERGMAYRFKVSLQTVRMSIVDPANSNAVWSQGIEFGFQGTAGHEVIESASGLLLGELDWSVLIENPTTPNNLLISFTDSATTIPITISGATIIPADKRTYNLAEIVSKAIGFMQEEVIEGITSPSKRIDRVYTLSASGVDSTGTELTYPSQDVKYGKTPATCYAYKKDPDSDDITDKVLKIKTVNSNAQEFADSIYVNESLGTGITKFVLQAGTSYSSVVFDEPVSITSDTTLPWKISTSYRQIIENIPNTFADGMEFVLLDTTTIRWYLTNQREDTVINNKIMSYYDIDITDINNPVLKKHEIKLNQKLSNGNVVSYQSNIVYKETVAVPKLTITANNPSLTFTREQSASFTPITASNGLAPYVFSVTPTLPAELILDSTTGSVSGIPAVIQSSKEYTISVIDDSDDKPITSAISIMVKVPPPPKIPSISRGAGIYAAGGDTNPSVDSSPFVIGGGGVGFAAAGPGGGGGVLYMPDGSVAREGIDYYLELVPGYGRIGDPVFYKDINVTSVDKVGGNVDYYPDGGLPDNRPGYKRTTYDNGHVILEQIPTAEWNPPLAQWNGLPTDERRSIIEEYMESRGISFVTNGEPNQIGAYEGDDLRGFLISKGITGESTGG